MEKQKKRNTKVSSVLSLTTGSIDGSGTFDALMKSVSSHLDSQYSKGRILGTDYAQSYIQILNATLEASIRYQKVEKDIESMKVADDLQVERIKTEKSNRLLIEARILTERKNPELIDQQILKLTKDIEASSQEILMLIERVKTEKLQPSIVENQIKKIEQDVKSSIENTKLIKANAELTIIKKDTETASAKLARANAELAKAKLPTEVSQSVLMEANAELAKARIISEEAKFKDTVNGKKVEGIIGKQKALYTKQALGFDRDAEQKAAKIFSDAFSIRRSTDPSGTPVKGTGLDIENSVKVMEKLIKGIGA